MNDLEQARSRWAGEQDSFRGFGKLIASRLEPAIKNRGIWVFVDSRPKEMHSLIRKLLRPGLTYEKLADKAGVRAIVRYLNDIVAVVEIARSLFRCSKPDYKERGLRQNRVGYLSVHIDVRLFARDSAVSQYPPNRYHAELQVRTLAQHLWSEMSHDSVYKNDETLATLPPKHRRRVNLLAGLLEVADNEFNRLNAEQAVPTEAQILKALERHYYVFTTRRWDAQLSLEAIRALLPLYNVGCREVIAHLDAFVDQHRAELQRIYAEGPDPAGASVFLFQPEIFMIFDRLLADERSLRRLWSRCYPAVELDRIANQFGVSFD